MASRADYESFREGLAAADIDFGIGGITLAPVAELDSEQEGYGGDDWSISWLVIGRETSSGDPIFVDLAEDPPPVLTAMHGEGSWDPERIADSLDGLATALDALARVADGRSSPVELDENPLPDDERGAFLRSVKDANPRASTDFWELVVTDPGL